MRIYLSKPHMGGTEQHYVNQAFDSNFIAPIGPQLNQFEANTAAYLGKNLHCVGLSSGSAALHLALRLSGVSQDDHVWVCSMTFAGGVFPVLYQKATPVFIDLCSKSWVIDCDILEIELAKANAANKLPKAIVPTDLYGQSVDLDRLEALTARYGIKLVVDSAESFGAAYRNDRKCGSGGDISILSFNGNKIITTSGGGMFVTKHADIAEQARFLATQARDPAPHYEHSSFGYNYRLSNVCAAIGIGQIEVLDERVTRRRKICARYQQALSREGITFMPEPAGYHSSKWLTALTFDPKILGVTREDVRLMLLEQQIEARPMWKPMHLQPLFKGTTYLGTGIDQDLFTNGLCLPSSSNMSDIEQDEVIDRILTLLNQQGS